MHNKYLTGNTWKHQIFEMLTFPPDLLEYWRIQGVLETRRKPGEFIVVSPSFDRNHARAEN